MILKHSYSLKLLRSKHLGPARLQHRAVQPEHSTSKAAGCLRNTQDCKKQSIPLYCNILRLQHWSLPCCALSSAPCSWRLEWELEETGGVHRVPKQQVASGHSIPQRINLVRVERGESQSFCCLPELTELTALTTVQAHQSGQYQRLQRVGTECWVCLSDRMLDAPVPAQSGRQDRGRTTYHLPPQSFLKPSIIVNLCFLDVTYNKLLCDKVRSKF